MKHLVISLLLCICFIANAQPFRFIVAADGSGTHTTIQAALDACPESERSLVFIKNGTYNEQVTLGTKTVTSTKKISLIGESATGVIITHSQSRASSGSPTYEDICTVKTYANDFYAENITIQNTAGNTGMAEALYTAGDRQTFKNCRILGYQDTYRSKKGTRGYFKNCWIEGAVDFIYAGGILFFDDCTINCVNGGGYIVAPEDAAYTIPKASTVCQKFIRVGFFFRNCNITANADVAANSYYLGRPWNVTAGTYYLNCKLGNHIKAAGWQTMGGNETTASFAEYNSMDASGTPVDVTGRISWSFQLPKADVDNLMTTTGIYGLVTTATYEPISLCIAASAPASITVVDKNISWPAVDGAVGYVLLKDGKYLASVSELTFTDNSGISGTYSVKSVGALGLMSGATSSSTAIVEVKDSELHATVANGMISLTKQATISIYSTSGEKVATEFNCISLPINNLAKGIYFLKMIESNGHFATQKIIIH
ncbi:MAG: pectinesterase family protein [Paludibacter sp.]